MYYQQNVEGTRFTVYTEIEAGHELLAETCLHQIAYPTMTEYAEYMCLINPGRCSKDKTCAYYRDNKPVTYARGFTNFQRRTFPGQYSQFMMICIGQWGRNPYFERRRGDRTLPPDEQKFILDALKRVGVTEEMKSDSYEENINRYDRCQYSQRRTVVL